MARPQNAPKGLFVKDQINVGTSELTGNSTGNLLLSGGVQLSGVSTAILTADSTGNVSASAGVKLSGEDTLLTANSTAIIGSVARLTLNSMDMRLASNSTGVGLQINTTGTTWLWTSTTSVGPA